MISSVSIFREYECILVPSYLFSFCKNEILGTRQKCQPIKDKPQVGTNLNNPSCLV